MQLADSCSRWRLGEKALRVWGTNRIPLSDYQSGRKERIARSHLDDLEPDIFFWRTSTFNFGSSLPLSIICLGRPFFSNLYRQHPMFPSYVRKLWIALPPHPLICQTTYFELPYSRQSRTFQIQWKKSCLQSPPFSDHQYSIDPQPLPATT